MASQILRNPQVGIKQPMPDHTGDATGSGKHINPATNGGGTGKVINGIEKGMKKGGTTIARTMKKT